MASLSQLDSHKIWTWNASMQPEGIAQALLIISFHERPSRLCHPDARKASGFPTRPPTSALFPAGRKAQPSSLREEVPRDRSQRKIETFSADWRTEPHVVTDRVEGNLDKPDRIKLPRRSGFSRFVPSASQSLRSAHLVLPIPSKSTRGNH